MEKLEGKVAVITGASKGIGEGIAKVYAKYGAKCVLAARGQKFWSWQKSYGNRGMKPLAFRQMFPISKVWKSWFVPRKNLRTGGYPGQ